MKTVLFLLVIFLSHVIQGITGFAGTVLAMPFALRLEGYGTAAAVLNLLGLLSGIEIFAMEYKHRNMTVLKQVLKWMGPFFLLGLFLRPYLLQKEQVMYRVLGVIVTALGIHGLYDVFSRKKGRSSVILLAAAGLVHGLFVTGGPLLIGWLSEELPEKKSFRATISAVWIVLNGAMFLSHIHEGLFAKGTVLLSFFSLPVFFLAMALGGRIAEKLSRRNFIILTDVLLILAGLSLLVK